jgi:hypothetical protein
MKRTRRPGYCVAAWSASWRGDDVDGIDDHAARTNGVNRREELAEVERRLCIDNSDLAGDELFDMPVQRRGMLHKEAGAFFQGEEDARLAVAPSAQSGRTVR